MTKPKPDLHEGPSVTSKAPKRRTSDGLQSADNNDSYDLVSDHNFIAPYEICTASIGLLSILVNRQINDVSFSKLYQFSLKIGWEKLFAQDRQKLKPNDISVSKCIALNRFLYECSKDITAFTKKTKILYNAIKSRMTTEFLSWTSDDLFKQVRLWRKMQCRRRLFYSNHEESVPLAGLLMLQKAATNWCHCLLSYYRQSKSLWESDGRRRFSEHFQHSFIIVAQPTGSEGAAATQYVKSSSGYFAKLNTRIICLLDPTVLQNDIELTDVDVTLYALNRETNDKKEKQPKIKWEIRQVLSAEGTPVSVYYAEVHTVQLGTSESESKRLPLNSTLCQLEFAFKIKVKAFDFVETIALTSQPFGICSHAQYFPKFVAQIFLYEMKHELNMANIPTEPDIFKEFVQRYYTRMTGFKLTVHTSQYLLEVFAQLIDDVKSTRLMNTLDHAFEDILTKLISQIDYLVMHPVLLLMYNDGLFFGICNSFKIDGMLEGTREQPHLLLRLNTLTKHQWNTNALVRFIVHDGKLRRASFDSKSFVNELCRFICESINARTKQAAVLSDGPTRYFSDFEWYFNEELYRLNKMSPPSCDAYDPLLPVLWMTMRQGNEQYIDEKDDDADNSTPRRKRTRSDSLPRIDSVTSGGHTSPINIVIHLENKEQSMLSSANSTIEQNWNAGASHEPKRIQSCVIEMPGDDHVSPEVIFRYLSDRFPTMFDGQRDRRPSNFWIRPDSTATPLDSIKRVHSSTRITSPTDHSPCSSHSSAKLAQQSADALHNDTMAQITVKEEPRDVDVDPISNKMILR